MYLDEQTFINNVVSSNTFYTAPVSITVSCVKSNRLASNADFSSK